MTTTASTPTSTSDVTAVRTRWPVSRVSIAAGAAALAVIEAYGAVAHAAGVPLRAAAFGAHTATQVNAGWLALGVALGTFWGTVLAVGFARRAARPARAFLATTLPLLALPLAARDNRWHRTSGLVSTEQAVLLMMHQVLAAELGGDERVFVPQPGPQP